MPNRGKALVSIAHFAQLSYNKAEIIGSDET